MGFAKQVLILAATVFSISGYTANSNPAILFAGKEGCLIVRELKSGRVSDVFNKKFCKERLYSCSTFKIALAAMAFDSGVLKDEASAITWDGTQYSIDAWNHDQTAREWMKNSTVWVSQKLTPKIGETRILEYLKRFKYGNQDFSGGVTDAWLSSTLKISAEEQVEFLRRLHLGKLGLRSTAADKTVDLLPLETTSNSVRMVGKTGSGFSWEDPAHVGDGYFRIGWYTGFLRKGSQDYVFAVVFREKVGSKKVSFGGQEAKRIAVQLLTGKTP